MVETSQWSEDGFSRLRAAWGRRFAGKLGLDRDRNSFFCGGNRAVGVSQLKVVHGVSDCGVG